MRNSKVIRAVLRSLFVIFVAALSSANLYAVSSSGGEYLPLSVGNKWVLRSKTVATPITLEVTSKSGNDFDLRFENPWVTSVLTVQPNGGAITLTALSMGGQRAPMPAGTVYYDFSARNGQSWSNRIGKITLVSRDKTVTTSSRRYDHCIEIQEVNSKGDKLYWFFAPGVGFVQFGEGAWAFVLDEGSSKLPGQSQSLASVATAAAPPAASAGRGTGPVRIALAANPAANEGFNPKTVNGRFDQSTSAGVSYVYLSPKWNELEPRKGKYNFKDIDFQIDQALRAGVPLVCNIRVIDTNQRAMPSDLQGRSMRDPEIKNRLLALIDALMPRLKGKAQYMLIGNEMDGYFKNHRNEVQDYRDLFQAGAAKMKQIQPGTQVSASITFDGISDIDLMKPILDQTDFFAVTYYPLSPDFTVRDPQTVPSDFGRMISAARGKKILLQEVGYPSSPTNNSSEEKQAQLFKAVFDQLRAHSSNFIGAYFFMMCDLPDSTVNQLAAYYKLANADKFRAFLKSLGMFDDKGRPKKSWQVFQQEAPKMKS